MSSGLELAGTPIHHPQLLPPWATFSPARRTVGSENGPVQVGASMVSPAGDRSSDGGDCWGTWPTSSCDCFGLPSQGDSRGSDEGDGLPARSGGVPNVSTFFGSNGGIMPP